MTSTHLCILLLAIVAASNVTGQNDEIPVENDNQFPPTDAPADVGDQIIEESGDGTLDEAKIGQPTEKITTPITPLEDVTVPSMYNDEPKTGQPTEKIITPITPLEDVTVSSNYNNETKIGPPTENITTPITPLEDITVPSNYNDESKIGPPTENITTFITPLEDITVPSNYNNETKIGQPTEEITTPITPLEDVIVPSIYNADQMTASPDEMQCPAMCMCNSEAGDSNSYVVDCSGYDLTEFPTPLDPRTTTLNVQNNKLTEIPKTISLLKNLQVLNAEYNSILDLALGSVSELEQLKILKLSNNWIRDYPMDLKNSFGLNNLEELDLGYNDMRTELTPELFSIFKSLKILTIPSSVPEKSTVIENLCGSLRGSLEKVCTDTCSTEEFECPDAPQNLDKDSLMEVIPGMIALDASNSDNGTSKDETNVGTEGPPEQLDATGVKAKIADSEAPVTTRNENVNNTISNPLEDTSRSANKEDTPSIQKHSTMVEMPPVEQTNTNNTDSVIKLGATTDTVADSEAPVTTSNKNVNNTISNPLEDTSRSANKEDTPPIQKHSMMVEMPPAEQTNTNNTDPVIKIGATTDASTGGVNKSVIGFIVAGMVLVVAGITIKKNWGSIRKRFSSSTRHNERTAAGTGTNVNGTSPEEVPLQQKNPV